MMPLMNMREMKQMYRAYDGPLGLRAYARRLFADWDRTPRTAEGKLRRILEQTPA